VTHQLPGAEQGCLLLADISGYSKYLQGTELEHSHDVLADLLETIIAGIEPPFLLSKLEGDAAFAYVPSTAVNPSMLLDTVEATYFAFRRRLRDIQHATTCDCNACVMIPSLDLKFFIHQGRYVIHRIARNEELTGSDVVLIHRLLKGTAGETAGTRAYAVYTASTFEDLGVDASILGLAKHTERLDDVGEVGVFIQNLEQRWAFEQERHRRVVTADEALEEMVGDFEVAPVVLWEWLTDPNKRLQYEAGLTGLDEVTGGRRGVGTVNHCAHGPNVAIQKVVDWRPFSTFTTEENIPGSPITTTETRILEATDTGTRLTVRMTADPIELWSGVAAQLVPGLKQTLESLQSVTASS
jgi:hypothetical protein